MIDFQTKGGVTVHTEPREDTSDWNTLSSCIGHDEYELADRTWTGVAFDIGAHVGGVTLALLADNPDLHVVAVEALPENREALRSNLAANGFADRATVPDGAASSSTQMVTIHYGLTDTEFASHHRFIGGLSARGPVVTEQPVSLTSLVKRYGRPALVKIDCEGCEWSFLDDPAVEDVAEFRGEYHPVKGHTPTDLRALLEPTHEVILDDSKTFGPFRAVHR